MTTNIIVALIIITSITTVIAIVVIGLESAIRSELGSAH